MGPGHLNSNRKETLQDTELVFQISLPVCQIGPGAPLPLRLWDTITLDMKFSVWIEKIC